MLPLNCLLASALFVVFFSQPRRPHKPFLLMRNSLDARVLTLSRASLVVQLDKNPLQTFHSIQPPAHFWLPTLRELAMRSILNGHDTALGLGKVPSTAGASGNSSAPLSTGPDAPSLPHESNAERRQWIEQLPVHKTLRRRLAMADRCSNCTRQVKRRIRVQLQLV